MTMGEKQRAVAIINLMVGIVIGVFLAGAVAISREGMIFPAIFALSACLLLVGYRIHRVFQVID